LFHFAPRCELFNDKLTIKVTYRRNEEEATLSFQFLEDGKQGKFSWETQFSSLLFDVNLSLDAIMTLPEDTKRATAHLLRQANIETYKLWQFLYPEEEDHARAVRKSIRDIPVPTIGIEVPKAEKVTTDEPKVTFREKIKALWKTDPYLDEDLHNVAVLDLLKYAQEEIIDVPEREMPLVKIGDVIYFRRKEKIKPDLPNIRVHIYKGVVQVTKKARPKYAGPDIPIGVYAAFDNVNTSDSVSDATGNMLIPLDIFTTHVKNGYVVRLLPMTQRSELRNFVREQFRKKVDEGARVMPKEIDDEFIKRHLSKLTLLMVFGSLFILGFFYYIGVVWDSFVQMLSHPIIFAGIVGIFFALTKGVEKIVVSIVRRGAPETKAFSPSNDPLSKEFIKENIFSDKPAWSVISELFLTVLLEEGVARLLPLTAILEGAAWAGLTGMFFSGTVSVGVVLTAFLFAWAHNFVSVGKQSREIFWFRLVDGLVLGAAYVITGNVFVPIIIHLLKNIDFYFIIRRSFRAQLKERGMNVAEFQDWQQAQKLEENRDLNIRSELRTDSISDVLVTAEATLTLDTLNGGMLILGLPETAEPKKLVASRTRQHEWTERFILQKAQDEELPEFKEEELIAWLRDVMVLVLNQEEEKDQNIYLSRFNELMLRIALKRTQVAPESLEVLEGFITLKVQDEEKWGSNAFGPVPDGFHQHEKLVEILEQKASAEKVAKEKTRLYRDMKALYYELAKINNQWRFSMLRTHTLDAPRMDEENFVIHLLDPILQAVSEVSRADANFLMAFNRNQFFHLSSLVRIGVHLAQEEPKEAILEALQSNAWGTETYDPQPPFDKTPESEASDILKALTFYEEQGLPNAAAIKTIYEKRAEVQEIKKAKEKVSVLKVLFRLVRHFVWQAVLILGAPLIRFVSYILFFLRHGKLRKQEIVKKQFHTISPASLAKAKEPRVSTKDLLSVLHASVLLFSKSPVSLRKSGRMIEALMDKFGFTPPQVYFDLHAIQRTLLQKVAEQRLEEPSATTAESKLHVISQGILDYFPFRGTPAAKTTVFLETEILSFPVREALDFVKDKEVTPGIEELVTLGSREYWEFGLKSVVLMAENHGSAKTALPWAEEFITQHPFTVRIGNFHYRIKKSDSGFRIFIYDSEDQLVAESEDENLVKVLKSWASYLLLQVAFFQNQPGGPSAEEIEKNFKKAWQWSVQMEGRTHVFHHWPFNKAGSYEEVMQQTPWMVWDPHNGRVVAVTLALRFFDNANLDEPLTKLVSNETVWNYEAFIFEDGVTDADSPEWVELSVPMSKTAGLQLKNENLRIRPMRMSEYLFRNETGADGNWVPMTSSENKATLKEHFNVPETSDAFLVALFGDELFLIIASKEGEHVKAAMGAFGEKPIYPIPMETFEEEVGIWLREYYESLDQGKISSVQVRDSLQNPLLKGIKLQTTLETVLVRFVKSGEETAGLHLLNWPEALKSLPERSEMRQQSGEEGPIRIDTEKLVQQHEQRFEALAHQVEALRPKRRWLTIAWVSAVLTLLVGIISGVDAYIHAKDIWMTIVRAAPFLASWVYFGGKWVGGHDRLYAAIHAFERMELVGEQAAYRDKLFEELKHYSFSARDSKRKKSSPPRVSRDSPGLLSGGRVFEAEGEYYEVDKKTMVDLDFKDSLRFHWGSDRLEGLIAKLNRTKTSMGSSRLAWMVRHPSLAVEVIRSRQEVVGEFMEQENKREKLSQVLQDSRAGDRALESFGRFKASFKLEAPFLFVGVTVFIASILIMGPLMSPAIILGIFILWAIAYQFLKASFSLFSVRRDWKRVGKLIHEILPLLEESEAPLLTKIHAVLQASIDSETSPEVSAFLKRPFVWRAISVYKNNEADLHKILGTLGELDALLSIAQASVENLGYESFPEVVEGHNILEIGLSDEQLAELGIDISEGHHPGIAMEDSVANSIIYNNERFFAIVTGVNMGGKSTLIRMLAFEMILAQIGAPVRAKAMRLSPAIVMTLMEIKDDLDSRQSLYDAGTDRFVEMVNFARKEPRVFLGFDEMTRATNAEDQIVTAESALTVLARNRIRGILTIHELQITKLVTEEAIPGLFNMHFAERPQPEETPKRQDEKDQSKDPDALRKKHMDHILHEGPATTTNAIPILERKQLDLEILEEIARRQDKSRSKRSEMRTHTLDTLRATFETKTDFSQIKAKMRYLSSAEIRKLTVEDYGLDRLFKYARYFPQNWGLLAKLKWMIFRLNKPWLKNPIDIYKLEMPSPFIDATHVETQTIHSYYYVPRNVEPGKKIPAVVIPGYVYKDGYTRPIALYLASRGIAVVEMTLPYYSKRAPPEVHGEKTTPQRLKLLDFDGSRFVDFMLQSASDVEASLRWLARQRNIDTSRLGVSGESVTGSIALIAHLLSELSNSLSIFIPVSDFSKLFWQERYQIASQHFESKGVTQEIFAKTTESIHLHNVAAGHAKNPANMLIGAVSNDELVPFANVTKLHELLGSEVNFLVGKGVRFSGSAHNSGFIARGHKVFRQVAKTILNARSEMRSDSSKDQSPKFSVSLEWVHDLRDRFFEVRDIFEPVNREYLTKKSDKWQIVKNHIPQGLIAFLISLLFADFIYKILPDQHLGAFFALVFVFGVGIGANLHGYLKITAPLQNFIRAKTEMA